MSVYVGIEVHRKRSQVAVVAEDGKVQLKQEHGDRTEPTLRLIGDLPAGTPVAYGAAFGWSWLADLLEDYGLRPAPGAPAAVQGDRLSCEICQRTVAYRPGSLSEVLTEDYRRAHPEALGTPSR